MIIWSNKVTEISLILNRCTCCTQASVTGVLPKLPAAAVCVSAECVSRMFLCDEDKLSLEEEVEVALFSMLLSSSVAGEE